MKFLFALTSTLRLPLILSRVPAGFPSPAEDFIDGSLDLNDYIIHPAATYFVKAEGESMIGAGIYDGDLLIVDKSLEPKNGSIVIASVMGDLTVKRLTRDVKGVWLLAPENPDYPTIPLLEESQIWGVVKNSVRNLE